MRGAIGNCPACGYAPGPSITPESAAYARGHRDAHLAKFPNADAITRKNLDYVVELAERGAIAGPVFS